MKNIIITVLVIVLGAVGYVAVVNRQDGSPVSSDESSEDQDIIDTADTTASSGKTLSLENSGINTVPQSTFDNASVTTLDVSNNNLTGALPAEIRKLKNLEILDASSNNMTGIPAEIGQLSKLREASFANNDISGLPLEIGNLSNLETLDLRGNPNVSTYDLEQIQPKIPYAEILYDK